MIRALIAGIIQIPCLIAGFIRPLLKKQTYEKSDFNINIHTDSIYK